MLKLNRKLSNHAFESWVLQKDLVTSATTIPLPAPVTKPDHGVGYLATKIRLFNNSLHQVNDDAYYLAQGSQVINVYEVNDAAVLPVAGLPSPDELRSALGGLIESASLSGVLRHEGTAEQSLLVTSTGGGDLFLIDRSSDCGAAPVYPLRPPAPLQGVRPFVLEAAYFSDADTLRCVAWAVRPKGGTAAPAVCEVYLLTFSYSGQQPSALSLVTTQLLQTSASPPHAVVVDATLDSVLLALDPESRLDEAMQPGPQQEAAAEEPPVEGDEDPRNLQGAVEALAKFTSETVADGKSEQHIADLFSEAGPGGEGALGAEPACTLVLFTPKPSDSGPTQLAEAERMACGAHRTLGVRRGDSAGPTLLGLTNDVDCAVVQLGIVRGFSGDDAAAAVEQLPAGASSEEQQRADNSQAQHRPRISATHVVSIPALAYVAAGKTQRKALLLAPPGGRIAAALVEAQTFAYVYAATGRRQQTGGNALLELQDTADGTEVLGAALLAPPGKAQLLVLFANEVKMFQLQNG